MLARTPALPPVHLDLGSVTLTRPREITTSEVSAQKARLEQNDRENAAFRRHIRDERRAAQNGDAESGVTEGVTNLHWDPIPLEAYGQTAEAVAQAIRVYENRGKGPNAHRFGIRFFAVQADMDGGFVARGRAYREAI